MTYNGFASQEQFHAWMRAQWRIESAKSVLAQLEHGWCDHDGNICREV